MEAWTQVTQRCSEGTGKARASGYRSHQSQRRGMFCHQTSKRPVPSKISPSTVPSNLWRSSPPPSVGQMTHATRCVTSQSPAPSWCITLLPAAVSSLGRSSVHAKSMMRPCRRRPPVACAAGVRRASKWRRRSSATVGLCKPHAEHARHALTGLRRTRFENFYLQARRGACASRI